MCHTAYSNKVAIETRLVLEWLLEYCFCTRQSCQYTHNGMWEGFSFVVFRFCILYYILGLKQGQISSNQWHSQGG